MQNNEQVSVLTEGHVCTIVLNCPLHNFVDVALLRALANRLEALDTDTNCRAVVLASEGKVFCAGADSSDVMSDGSFVYSAQLYTQAMRLFRTRKPIVAAVQGAAIGAARGWPSLPTFGLPVRHRALASTSIAWASIPALA